MRPIPRRPALALLVPAVALWTGTALAAPRHGTATPSASGTSAPSAASATSAASITTASDLVARVDAAVRAEMARQKIPGLALAVVGAGGPLVVRGYGFSNVEHRVPVTAETMFQSGSVGKQFTAALVMMLVEEGKVGLDDPLPRFFQEAPESWREIRVRHLLTHTSGIPEYTDDKVDLRRDYTEDDLARLAAGLVPDFPPGSKWSYSNTGYVLLGVLVHRVTGRFYGDLLGERIFTPLGMRTARVISEADIVPNRAAGYRLADGELKNQEWVSPSLNTTADGALYLSISDLVAWDAGLRRGALLRPESWAQIYTPVALTGGGTYPYGFGWAIDEAAGGPRYHHGGSWQGFKAYISRYLAADLTVIALANLADARLEPIVDAVAALADPRLAPPPPAEPPAGE